jgi:hypothetical protein
MGSMISEDSSAGKYSCGTPIRRPVIIEFEDTNLPEILVNTCSRTLGGAAVGSSESYEQIPSIWCQIRRRMVVQMHRTKNAFGCIHIGGHNSNTI